ncbi:hypothetical protein [Burkholderia territorii]|uniref:hypothetical protein n=1 Tax=Burkholderia territorii TaxID=1503055 RepID=UPI000A69DC7D|nr:hypothetical protein [Burkholderia territorii]
MSSTVTPHGANPGAQFASSRALVATLRVEYDLQGERLRALQELVHQAIVNAIGSGALTGGTAAIVEDYELQVHAI